MKTCTPSRREKGKAADEYPPSLRERVGVREINPSATLYQQPLAWVTTL